MITSCWRGGHPTTHARGWLITTSEGDPQLVALLDHVPAAHRAYHHNLRAWWFADTAVPALLTIAPQIAPILQQPQLF